MRDFFARHVHVVDRTVEILAQGADHGPRFELESDEEAELVARDLRRVLEVLRARDEADSLTAEANADGEVVIEHSGDEIVALPCIEEEDCIAAAAEVQRTLRDLART